MEAREEEVFADLGNLPALCSTHLLAAAGELETAGRVAAEMERLAKPGVQKQEPIGLKGACASMKRRLRLLAKRAERIA